MPDELADLFKRYVKEALAEYFREMQREGEELGFLPPFWLVPRGEWRRYYRDVGERFVRNMARFESSVSRLATLVAKPEDWTPRCSEKDNIASIQRDVTEVKNSVQQTAIFLRPPGAPTLAQPKAPKKLLLTGLSKARWPEGSRRWPG